MKHAFFLILLFSLFSCHMQNEKFKTLQNRVDSLENLLNDYKSTEYMAQSMLWFQHSPEMQALYLQSYNTAKQALVYNLKHKMHKGKKNAVVVDIDETILSNDLYDGWLYLSRQSYADSTWNAWVNDAIAEPLPGTVDFLNFAASLGCEIFYVSNRKKDPLFEPTLVNLQKFNLPYADEKHLLLKTNEDKTASGKTTKEVRRQKIENELNYEILLLCGDQMADFDKAFDVFAGGTEEQIKDSVNAYKEKFGSRFIVLPNPVYCDWLTQVITGGKPIHSIAQLDSLRKSNIESWNHK